MSATTFSLSKYVRGSPLYASQSIQDRMVVHDRDIDRCQCVAFVVQKLLPGSFPKAEGYLALSVAA